MSNYEWHNTDDFQFCKQINGNEFHYVEIVELEGKYSIRSGIIDYNDYTTEEVLEYISSYGYTSIEHLEEIYGEDKIKIAVECIFETSNDFDSMEWVSEEECAAKIFRETGFKIDLVE